MHTAFFGLPNNSQVIRVRGAAAPRVFLTRITCFRIAIDAFSDDFGLIFNCGFCRTLVLECSVHQSDGKMKRTAGRKKNSENVVRSDLSVLF